MVKFEIENIAEHPLMMSKPGMVITFDSNGICREVSAKKMGCIYSNRTQFFHKWEDENLPRWLACNIHNNPAGRRTRALHAIIKKLVPGETTVVEFEREIEEMLIECYKLDILEIQRRRGILRFSLDTNVEEFILSIKASFRRIPENMNTKTFDFVECEISIHSSWTFEQSKEFISTHAREIIDKCVIKLEADKRYQKYGVPTNFLKVSNLVLRRNGLLSVLFELKC